MTHVLSNRQTLAVITAALLYVTFIPDVTETTVAAPLPLSGLIDTPIEIAAAVVDASPAVAVTEGGAVVDVTTAPPPPITTLELWPSDRVLASLRKCEATTPRDPTGDYRITTTWDGYPSIYSGAYQFDQPTWNATALRHAHRLIGVYPADASPGDQDAMARWLWQDRGPAPWPTCGPRAERA